MLAFLKRFQSRDTSGTALPPLRFYNTLSGTLETFTPLSEKEVRMYNCGPTVYDEQHIGNMFAQVFSNTLRRTLDAWGYSVKQVVNITDVGHLTGDNQGDADSGEDRMEASAKKKGRSAQDIAREITALYFADLDRLGVDRERISFPRATEYIEEQIALVQALKEKGYAYKISDGIYFDTAKFPQYGKLGSIDLEGQQEGARVEENTEKRSRHDFALWKFSPKDEQREQEWDSPWGVGFPGWHIECTAMIFKLLGKQIDIHTGGIEHIPVHHNNEIAQAESVTGKQYVRYWMHNAHITLEGKKISKSLGNTVYLRNIVDKGYSPRAFRLWALTGHYRTPANFTWEAVEGAHTALKRLSRVYFEELGKETSGVADPLFVQEFGAALADDLNTPQAIARMWELVKDTTITPSAKKAALEWADNILGLGFTEERPIAKLTVVERDILPAEVQTLLTAREEARKAKDFAKADEARDAIHALGYEIVDTADGPTVQKKA